MKHRIFFRKCTATLGSKVMRMFFVVPSFFFGTSLILSGCSDKKEQKLSVQDETIRNGPEKKGGCENLHTVTDINDLLLQMYENLDSHCLFQLPRDDLEKKWGIKVFGGSRYSNEPESKSRVDGPYFRGKPYRNPADAIFVSKLDATSARAAYFQIEPTNAFLNSGGTFFPSGRFPQGLPRPYSIRSCTSSAEHGPHVVCTDEQIAGGDLKKNTFYYWVKNGAKSSPVLFFRVGEKPDQNFIFQEQPLDWN